MVALFPPRVTIKLSENQKVNRDGTVTYGEPSTGAGKIVTISVKKSFYPDPHPKKETSANFYEYKHTSTESFMLREIKDDTGMVINFKGLKGVSGVASVSAYYWKYENGSPSETPGKVLIVGITTNDKGSTEYYARSTNGRNWTKLNKESRLQIVRGDIEKELDDLVCDHHNAVTLDLTEILSKELSEKPPDGNRYCCTYHESIPGKVTVTKEEIIVNGERKVDYYKHSIDDGHNISGIKYYENKIDTFRRRIISSRLEWPIKGPVDVYTIYCRGKPALIHVELKEKKPTVKNWYRRSKHGDDAKWKKISGKLKGVTPGNIIKCKNWNKLVRAIKKLKSCELSPCFQSRGHTEEPDEGEISEDQDTGEEPDEESSEEEDSSPEPESKEVPAADLSDQVPDTESEAKPDQTSDSGDQMNEEGKGQDPLSPQLEAEHTTSQEDTAALTVVAPAASIPIGYIISGVFGGSGAAGFGGWKIYKSLKQDPWVRQI